jgi:hypothetical protein
VPAPPTLPVPFPTCATPDVGCGAYIAAPAGATVELRGAAELAAPAQARLPGGTPVFLLELLRGGPEGTWWRVRTVDGVEGWVSGEDQVQPAAP